MQSVHRPIPENLLREGSVLQTPPAPNPREPDRLLLIAGKSVQNVDLSLDKLTIVGDLRNEVTFGKYLGSEIDILRDTLAKFPYHLNFLTASGTVLQMADKQSPVPQVRISFNPADPNQADTASKVLRQMKNKRATRIDWAIDYPCDLSDWIFTTTKAKSSRCFLSASGKLETLYLGSRESDSMYRIYDKAKESNLPGILWRVEHELKLKADDPWQFRIPFGDLHCVKASPDLPSVDRIMLDGLHRNPELWGHLSDRAKKKYRNLLKDHKQMRTLDPWPRDAYVSKAQPFVDQLDRYIRNEV